MRGVAKRRLAKGELIGRNGVKFVYLMPPTVLDRKSTNLNMADGSIAIFHLTNGHC